MPIQPHSRAQRRFGLPVLAILALVLLGSTAGPCCSGDCHDRSDALSGRWHDARARDAPQWTPDSSQVVFGHQGRIYVVDTDGSELVSLSGSFEPLHVFSDTNDLDFSPSVSPDGSMVVYSTLRYAKGRVDYGSKEHDYEIATMTIGGRERRRLTDNERHDVLPVWSPDGSHIAFVSGRRYDSRLYVMAPDGSGQLNLAPALTIADQPPVWSPDGSRLAFMVIEEEQAEIPYIAYPGGTPTPKVWEGVITRYAAHTVRTDGSGLTRLEWTRERSQSPQTRSEWGDVSQPEEYMGGLTWSPDSQRLVFAANFYGEPPALYSIGADGSDVRLLYPSSGAAGIEEKLLQPIVARFRDDFSVHIQVTSLGIDETQAPTVVNRRFVVDPGGGEPRLLNEEQGHWLHPQEWPAPSGARSAYLRDPSGREDHVVIFSGPRGQPERRKPLVINEGGRLIPANRR